MSSARRGAARAVRAARLAGLALVLVVVAADRPAWAQDDNAAELKKSGNEKMVESDFVGALEDYQKALAIAPNDLGLYYNIGRAHGFLGHHPESLHALEAFDARATAEQKAKIAMFAGLVAETRLRVGYLTLSCGVPTARVQLAEKVVGSAPLARVAVEAGVATMRIDAEGYLDDVRSVTIEGTKELTLDCRLLPKSTSGTLVANATPTGARISVDGKFLGNSHVEIPLPSGPHAVVAERDGYEKTSMSVVVNVGYTKRLDIPLQPTPVPLTSRWWFWSGIGAVVVGGIVVSAALVTERSADKGSIPPRQLATALRF